jgi:hypothetical protein
MLPLSPLVDIACHKTPIMCPVLIQGIYFEWFEIHRKLQPLNQERNLVILYQCERNCEVKSKF